MGDYTYDPIGRARAAGRDDIADWLTADKEAHRIEREERANKPISTSAGELVPDGRRYNITIRERAYGRRTPTVEKVLKGVRVIRTYYGTPVFVYPSGARRHMYGAIVAIEPVE